MVDRKRILILTSDAGFGHRSAANAIAAALEEQHGESCQVDIVNPLEDERAPSVLRDSQTDYDRLVREMPDIYRLRYQISDTAVPNAIMESIMTVMLYRVIDDIVKRYTPDVIVITHPMFPAPINAVVASRKMATPVITVITDMGAVHRMWFNSVTDLCLVPNDLVKQVAIENGLPPDKVQISGIPANPVLSHPVEDKATLRQKLGWQPDLTTALVVSSKRVKNLEAVLHVLNHSALPLQKVIVAGGDDDMFAYLEQTEWHGPTALYNYVKNLPEMMLAADLIVCKAGGLITTEALACGLPLLLVDVTPGQEEGNAEYVVKHGAGSLATDPIQALESLFHWLEHDGALLAEVAANARALGQPKAAYTAADFIWAAAERGSLPEPESRSAFLPKLRELLSQFGITSESASST